MTRQTAHGRRESRGQVLQVTNVTQQRPPRDPTYAITTTTGVHATWHHVCTSINAFAVHLKNTQSSTVPRKRDPLPSHEHQCQTISNPNTSYNRTHLILSLSNHHKEPPGPLIVFLTLLSCHVHVSRGASRPSNQCVTTLFSVTWQFKKF